MNKFSRLVFLFIIGFLTVTATAQTNWRPVSQAELDMKTPQVEADADAEAIFWEVSLDDKKRKKLFYNHYVRVKIFTERGREKFSKIDIPFAKGKIVEEVAARVIKPDGTIIALNPGDIFEREIIRYGKIRVLAKSFAMPSIEPGVIIEYQYKETFKNDSAEGERLIFQRDIPMQRVTYSVRPFEGTLLGFDFHNMEQIDFNSSKDGFYVGSLSNVPALKEEPNMPPEDEIMKWVQLSYKGYGNRWNGFASDVNEAFGKFIESNKEIEEKAAELTNNLPTKEEKLQSIYDFTQKQIRNITFDNSLTDEQKAKFEIKNTTDTLRKRMGHEGDINFLFAALAKAAGFPVALILATDRSENFFTPNRSFYGSGIHPAGIAVSIYNTEKYVNPGNPYLPFGKLQWYEEGAYAMIAGETYHAWKKLPVANYLESSVRRTGKFKLLEDGTLEGTMMLEYDGHQAISRRMSQYKESSAKREENIKEEIKKRISTAEISDIRISNFDDAEKMLTYSMKIRIPNYAAKTGKRLFFQPGFFEYGTKPMFSSATRNYPIYYEFPWSEEDIIEIELPKTFLTDNAASPGDVKEGKNIAALTINMSLVKETNTLKYNRRFYFGNGVLFFQTASYPALKTLWENILKSDSHTISIKQTGD